MGNRKVPRGIVSYATYVPRYRLDRSAVATPPAIGVSATFHGERSVASFDEDAVTMAIEAARRALLPGDPSPDGIYFSTASPPYLEKTNATTIHAALRLEPRAAAVDLIGSPRSAAAAFDLALSGTERILTTFADIRTSLPGGGDERDGGDAAAAFVFGDGEDGLVAEHLASATLTEDMLDRWGVPTEPFARRWEERFGQEVYVPLGQQALAEALRTAGLEAGQIDRLAVSCPNGRGIAQFARASGVRRTAIGDDLLASIGNTGAAHGGLLLAQALDAASAGEILALVTLSDGATVQIFRATEALVERRAPPSEDQPKKTVSYNEFLVWRGMLKVEPARRSPSGDLAAPALRRSAAWKVNYDGSRCLACGEVHFPLQRVCQRCHSADEMERIEMSRRQGLVVGALIDRITRTLAPPAIFAIVNLDEGGRIECEITEAEGVPPEPGERVELVFRRVMTSSGGIHNYFWKARTLVSGGAL